MSESPESQFAGFLAKYDPEVADLALEVLAKLRDILPGAVELVYDNYNALVIGFGPTERIPSAPISIALYPRWINLYFLQGVRLPDPNGLLRGDGKQVRSVRLDNAQTLDRPEIRALIEDAVTFADEQFDTESAGRMIIKSVSAKQRPRRPHKL